MAPHRIDDPKQWRDKAEEARAMADQLTNPDSKRTMLEIALCYVQLAQLAEERRRRRD